MNFYGPYNATNPRMIEPTLISCRYAYTVYMYMYVCMYVCMYIYIYIYICTHIFVHISYVIHFYGPYNSTTLLDHFILVGEVIVRPQGPKGLGFRVQGLGFKVGEFSSSRQSSSMDRPKVRTLAGRVCEVAASPEVICTYLHTYIESYIYMYVYVCIHIYIYIYIYICIHTRFCEVAASPYLTCHGLKCQAAERLSIHCYC